MAQYYAFLSTFTSLVSAPLRDLGDALNMPLVTALLLGLIGATSPCQLTTNLSALAYVGRQAGQPRLALRLAGAYMLGKAMVYSLVGLVVIGFGIQLERQSVPVVIVARKVLGPFMILAGLAILGLLRLRFSFGNQVTDWLAKPRASDGTPQAFLLGLAYAFAFCPTLFLLFFGLLIPLALRSPNRILFPGLFAVGTTLPLLGLVLLLSQGAASLKSRLGTARRWGYYANLAAGAVFLLAGLNDTLIYWLL